MKKLLVLFLLLVPYSALAGQEIGSAVGVVQSVNPRQCSEEELVSNFLADGREVQCMTLLVKLEGGQQVAAENVVQSALDTEVGKGTKVVLYTMKQDGKTIYAVRDYDHLGGMGWGVVVLVLGVVMIGGWKGVKALLALGVGLALIFGVLMPLLLQGWSPIWLTLVVGAGVAAVSLFILNGWRRKTLVMTLGTVGGVGVATVCALVFGWWAQVGGLGTHEVRDLALIMPGLDFQGLLFAGMVLGSLGAVMDTAVSITSAMGEVRRANKKYDFQQLWEAGMGVGRDIMGSMMNTLVFAYVGSAYAVIFTFMALGELGFWEIVNLGFISEEMVRSLVGSFGLLATIPITAVLNATISVEE